jgi:hypothetical protein
MKIKVERRIPIPAKQDRMPGDRSKYPWIRMKVGESFFVPNIGIVAFSSRVVHAAERFGTKYTCRTEGKGVRVWRVK